MTPDFSCERCQDALPWYVAGSLSDMEQREIEQHLAACPACRMALAEWRKVAAATSRAEERIPADTGAATTWAGIHGQLHQHNIPAALQAERNAMRLSDGPALPALTGAKPKPNRRHRPAGRGRPFAAIAAAVALVALSTGIFALLSSHGRPSVAVTPTATAKPTCSPSKATADVPAHAKLNAVAPIGTDDGWAVGSLDDGQGGAPQTVILHLRDCHWSTFGDSIPGAELLDIAMGSAQDGWAVGAYVRKVAESGDGANTQYGWEANKPLLMHFANGAWHVAQAPGDSGQSTAKIRMVSANEGWMLIDRGRRMTIINSTTAVPSYSYTLLHLQGSTWSEVALSFQAPSMILTDLDAKAPGECWVVGYDTQRFGSVAAHYDNGSWQRWVGAGGQEPTDVFTSVSEAGPNDVWAAGTYRMYHFDGVTWAKVPVVGTEPHGTADGIMSLQVLATGEGWEFVSGMFWDQHGFLQAVLHYRNGQWSWEQLSLGSNSPDRPISSLSGIALVSPMQGWAIARSVNGLAVSSQFAYLDGGTWGLVTNRA